VDFLPAVYDSSVLTLIEAVRGGKHWGHGVRAARDSVFSQGETVPGPGHPLAQDTAEEGKRETTVVDFARMNINKDGVKRGQPY